MNFLGLGATVGIKDAGATKIASSLAGAFSNIGGTLAKVASTAGVAGLALGALANTKIGGKVMDLGHAITGVATAGQEFTTSYEAAAQQHSVSTRRMIAQTGIFGKELNKANAEAAGMAHGMGFSDEVAAHAVATLKQFNPELKALGINSALSAARVEEGLGVSIRDVAFQMHRLKDGMKLTDKEMEEVAKSMTATGESIHDVGAPFKHMTELMDLAQQRSNLVATGLSSIGGKESMKSMNRAVQSLYTLTGDSKGAQQAALGLEATMIKSMRSFGDMFAGTSNDLDNFLINTSVVTGDVKQAFKAASQGPDAFIKSFGGVIANLKKSGKSGTEILNFFQGQMKEAGIEGLDVIVTALANADEAKLETMKATKDVGKSLDAMGKDAWRSTKTMQDAFDMMMGSAKSRFRAIGREASQTFIKDTGKAFATFNAAAEKAVKEGSGLGMLYTKMSEMSQLGAVSLLPKALRPMVGVFGEMFKTLAPSVAAFATLASALGALLGPLLIIVAVLGTLGYLMMKNKTKTNTWTDAFVLAIGDIKKYMMQAWDWLKAKFGEAKVWIAAKIQEWGPIVKQAIKDALQRAKDFDWKGFFKDFFGGVAAAIKMATKQYTAAGNLYAEILTPGASDEGSIMSMMKDVAKAMWEGIKEGFKSIEWGPLFANLADSVLKSRQQVMDAIVNLFDSATKGADMEGSIGPGMWEALKGVLVFVFKMLYQGIEFFVKLLWIFLKNVWWEAWKALMGAIWGPIWKALVGMFESVVGALKSVVDGLYTILIKPFVDAFHWIVSAWSKTIAAVKLVFQLFMAAIDLLFIKIFGFSLIQTLQGWSDKVMEFITDVKDYFVVKFEEVYDSAVSTFDKVYTTITEILVRLKDAFVAKFDAIKDKIIDVWENHIKPVWETVEGFFSRVINAIVTEVTTDIMKAVKPFLDMKKAAEEALSGVMEHAKKLFGNSINTYVGQDMDETTKVIQSATVKMKEYIEKALFEGVTAAISKAFVQAFKNVIENSKDFFAVQLKAFDSFGQKVVQMFRSMWIIILNEMQEAANASAATIKGALADLQNLKGALDAVAAAKSEVIAGADKSTEVKNREGGVDPQRELLLQVAQPDWYQKEYKAQFARGISDIVNAVNASRGTNNAGGAQAGSVADKFTKLREGGANLMNPARATTPNGGRTK